VGWSGDGEAACGSGWASVPAQPTLHAVDLRDPDRHRQLELLSAEIVACRACPRLVAWRERVATEKRAAYRDEEYWGKPVPGFGDPDARLVIVGLAPAAHGANRTGRMFTGDHSGLWLYRALHRAGFASQPESLHRGDGMVLTDAWITAPVRCAPPANKPTPVERDTCRPFIDRELALLARARVFVVLGAFGYQVTAGLLGLRPRPRFAHGLEVQLGDGRWILCSYHVSQQNTFTGTLTEDMLDGVFGRARELATRGAGGGVG
jgi:uracil-DNA glycosylase